MPLRTRFHPEARAALSKLDRKTQVRIYRAVTELEKLDDARQRLIPYAENLKGFWKLRVGDYRLVCELKRDAQGELVLIIHVVHRSRAYIARSIRTIKDRANDN